MIALTTPSENDTYAAGFVAGRIDSRLESLEHHNVQANGHLAELSVWSIDFRKEVRDAFADVRMELARLSQDSIAKEARVAAAAEAVESARVSTARQVSESKERSEVIEIPWTRIGIFIAALSVVAAVVFGIVQIAHG